MSLPKETSMKHITSRALLGFQRTTRIYIPDDRTLHNLRCGNPESGIEYVLKHIESSILILLRSIARPVTYIKMYTDGRQMDRCTDKETSGQIGTDLTESLREMTNDWGSAPHTAGM
jgi:hypothetical protein